MPVTMRGEKVHFIPTIALMLAIVQVTKTIYQVVQWMATAGVADIQET
jgi:hypothetical protein